jgi:hypothetical protein
MIEIIFDYITKARKEAKDRNIVQSELLYTKAIDEIKRRIKSVDIQRKRFWVLELWWVLSEFLNLRSEFPHGDETFEDARKMRLNSLRYMHKAIASGHESIDGSHLEKQRMLQKMTIYKFGCILPESDTQLEISCPIYIRNGLPFPHTASPASVYEKNLCSICESDILDEKCVHIPGKEYDGKKCTMIPHNLTFLHLAVVDRPKDPRSMVVEISEPKNWSLDRLSAVDRARKLKYNLPTICYLCRDRNIDPSEISSEKYFEMQRISIDIENGFD